MIISIVTGPWLPVPAIQGGAVNRRWQGVAEVFAAKGHQVRIICRSYPGQPSYEIINGVTYIRQGGFSQSTNIKLDLIKDLIYALKNFTKIPAGDILVINDFWLPVFAPLCPKVGKLVVNAARFPKGQYWLYAKTDRFIAVSRAIKEAIVKENPLLNTRTKVIPNPINTNVFYPSWHSKIKNHEKVILYVGRIHPEKGIHLLLDAFSILSQQIYTIKLRIIGPVKENQGGGGETYLNTLKFCAEKLNVEFLEPIFNVYQLAEAYRQADIFCYPSLAAKGESFGVAPLEAMASGLVPVVSDLACFKDFIEDSKTGYFFNHRSVDAAKNLAEKLALAIINCEANDTMRIQAAQKAKEFSYEQVSELYLAFFQQLLATK